MIQGIVQSQIYIRVGATTTIPDFSVENSVYIPLSLNLYVDHCVG